MTGFVKNKRGVTLLELLIVLSIMTLIVSLPLVSFGKFANTTKLNVAAKNVSAVLKLVKSYAVSTSSDHSFNIDATNLSEFWVADAAAQVVGDKYKLPETITFANIAPPPPITFKPLSGSSSIVEITLRNTKGDMKKIKVSDTSGKIIIE